MKIKDFFIKLNLKTPQSKISFGLGLGLLIISVFWLFFLLRNKFLFNQPTSTGLIFLAILVFVISFIILFNCLKKALMFNDKNCQDKACSSHYSSNKSCSYCGSKVSSGDYRCPVCENFLEIKCSKCGYINKNSNTYCVNCEHKLD